MRYIAINIEYQYEYEYLRFYISSAPQPEPATDGCGPIIQLVYRDVCSNRVDHTGASSRPLKPSQVTAHKICDISQH